ncbi:class I SAM-dependent methyltransferase [Oxyplasma meridianum]|uniref:Class I SAM-dependent methyltransferase n=1 Tax=Oxyplasma meridianum TaxID=3073602 RepID=A0AAX4NH55_9ARCH
MEWNNHNYARTTEMREKYIPFANVDKFLELKPDDNLLDVGPGDGFYALTLVKEVPRGTVTAMDLNEYSVNEIKKGKEAGNIKNLVVSQMDICTVTDFSHYSKVFFSNVFHDLKCRDKILDRMISTFRDKTRIIFIEFKKESAIGPPANIKISQQELKDTMKRHGFSFVKEEELTEHYMQMYTI